MSSVSLRIHRLEPQSARGRARLAKILDAAADLFLEVGYEQTSIDAILLRSGGSKSTLYAYFPTKQDLFRAVIDSVVANSEIGMALDISSNARVVLTEFAVSRQRVVMSPRHRAVLGLVIAHHVSRGLAESRDTRDRRRRSSRGVFHRHAVSALASAALLRDTAAAERSADSCARGPSRRAVLGGVSSRPSLAASARASALQSGTPGCADPSSHAAPSA
jgi:AcrR family transcriptional regulator